MTLARVTKVPEWIPGHAAARLVRHDDAAGIAPSFGLQVLDILILRRFAKRSLEGRTPYIWIGFCHAPSAASFTDSDMVGCAWQVRARSSAEPPNSISTAASWIISPAPKPRM